MTEMNVDAWREAIAGSDPEIAKFCSLMFHAMERRVFEDVQVYAVDEGRKLAGKMSIYATSKGFDVSEDEVLAGFKATAPQLEDMVKTCWEKVLGEYFHGEIDRAAVAKAAKAAKA